MVRFKCVHIEPSKHNSFQYHAFCFLQPLANKCERGKLVWGDAHVFLGESDCSFYLSHSFCTGVCVLCVIPYLQSQSGSYCSLEKAEAKICSGFMPCWFLLVWLTTVWVNTLYILVCNFVTPSWIWMARTFWNVCPSGWDIPNVAYVQIWQPGFRNFTDLLAILEGN